VRLGNPKESASDATDSPREARSQSFCRTGTGTGLGIEAASDEKWDSERCSPILSSHPLYGKTHRAD
jgi:hypothetical protein